MYNLSNRGFPGVGDGDYGPAAVSTTAGVDQGEVPSIWLRPRCSNKAIATPTTLLGQLKGTLDAPVPQDVVLGLQHPSG